MKVGDLVQVRLPPCKGRGIIVEKVHFDLPGDGYHYKLVNDYRWTVFYEGELHDFHQHNLEVISENR